MNTDSDFRRWSRSLAGGLLVLGLVTAGIHQYFLSSSFGHLVVDDAYISYRYAMHAAEGYGLVWNAPPTPEDYVEGYSNFLFTVMIIPFHWMGIALEDAGKYLGAVWGLCLVAFVPFFFHQVRDEFDSPNQWRIGAAVGLAFMALNGHSNFWAVMGLENSLYGLLLTVAGARFYLEWRHDRTTGGTPRRARFPWSAPLLVGLALTRPEGVANLVPLLLFGIIWNRDRLRTFPSRRLLTWLGFILFGSAAFLAFRLAYYGYPLPNAYYAKVGLSVSQLLRGYRYLLQSFFSVNSYLLLLLPFMFLALKRRVVQLMAALVLVGLTFIVIAGGDWSIDRYESLFQGPLGVICGFAAVELMALLEAGVASRWRHAVSAVVLLGLIGLHFRATTFGGGMEGLRGFVPADRQRIAFGEYLAATEPKETRIGVYAAGAIPYFSGLRAHDLLGLNDLHIAHQPRQEIGRGYPGHERYDVVYSLSLEPKYFVDCHYIPGFIHHPEFKAHYRPIDRPDWDRIHVWVRTE